MGPFSLVLIVLLAAVLIYLAIRFLVGVYQGYNRK
ncbi:hypothetical protein ABID49_002505 [Bhargavaea ullalensis]|uniref:Uncharacterized protein n=1 Tax=Bhargavaea ullalensis TaxID=1265685 RepID=A0ABV2GE86_9BACL